MAAPREYPDELRERAQRLVHEARQQEPALSLTAAVKRIGSRVGVPPDTSYGWCRQAEVDDGRRPGTTSEDAAELKALRADVRAQAGRREGRFNMTPWLAPRDRPM